MALVFRKQILQKCYFSAIVPMLETKFHHRNIYSTSTTGRIPAVSAVRHLATSVVRPVSQTRVMSDAFAKPAHQEEVVDSSIRDDRITKDVISKVNAQIQSRSYGRLFAVVYICGKQFKITDDDIIVIEGHWPPELGDELKLEKVLLVGGSDFTLIGRPTLSPDLVAVNVTVIEKTLSHIKTRFRKRRRKQYMRINFHRSPYTMLRVNSVQIKGEVNEKKDFEGIDERIF